MPAMTELPDAVTILASIEDGRGEKQCPVASNTGLGMDQAEDKPIADPRQPQLSPAAERMRRSRERQREGLCCLQIEMRKSEIIALCRRGYLPSEQLSDRGAIINALYRFFEAQLNL
jgi:hypothetical protein